MFVIKKATIDTSWKMYWNLVLGPDLDGALEGDGEDSRKTVMILPSEFKDSAHVSKHFSV